MFFTSHTMGKFKIFSILAGVWSLFLWSCQSGPQKPTLQIAHNWGGPEKEAFEEILKDFEDNNPAFKIQIRNIASSEYDPWILNQYAAGVAPDVFVSRSPGLIRELANADRLDDISDLWKNWADKKWFGAQWKALVEVNSKVMGLPFKTSAKGLVWYSPEKLKALGFENPPVTWKEFEAMMAKAAEQKIYPMLVGGKDGWPLTDWFEHLFIRLNSGEAFNKLAKQDLSWDSPEVKKTFESFKDLIEKAFPQDPLAVGFVEAVQARIDGAGLFQFQGGWVNLMTRDYNPSMTAGVDYDFFVLPAKTQNAPSSVILGGDFILASKGSRQKAGVDALFEYLASAEAQSTWVKQGGYIATNATLSLDLYPDTLARKEARLIREADELYFDLDDQYPAGFRRVFWESLQSFVREKDVAKTASRLKSESESK